MRSLFDDTKNPVFRLLCQIIVEIHAGAKFTRKEILQRIFSLPEFIYVEAPEEIREKKSSMKFSISTAKVLPKYRRARIFRCR